MKNQKKLPVSHVIAELGFLEFHQQKRTLDSGTYRVIEHDGEINYAVLGDGRGLCNFTVSWYDEDEYATATQYAAYNRRQDEFTFEDAEEPMDSWDQAMINAEDERLADEISMADHDEFRRVDALDFAGYHNFNQMVMDSAPVTDTAAYDDSLNASAEVASVKTIGDLLREHMNRHPADEVGYESSTQAEYDAAVAQRNGYTQTPMFNERPFIEADDLTEAEFENHRAELAEFNKRSSEQLDKAMESK